MKSLSFRSEFVCIITSEKSTVKGKTTVFKAEKFETSNDERKISFFKKPLDFFDILLYNSEAVFDMLL